jgi:hypothetical protein
MNDQDSQLVTLTQDDLVNVQGGGFWGAAARIGGKVLSKAALPLTVASTAWDGYVGYRNARARGESVSSALGSGAINAATLGLREEFR